MITSLAKYALTIPHHTYVDCWAQALLNLGSQGVGAKVDMWPLRGYRPSWWAGTWEPYWPFDKGETPVPQAIERRLSSSQEARGEGRSKDPEKIMRKHSSG